MSPNKYKTHWYSREESNTVGKDYPKTNMETNELKGFLLKPELTRTSDNMSSLLSSIMQWRLLFKVQKSISQIVLGREMSPKI